MQHNLKIMYQRQVVLTQSGNVPLFVPRVGDTVRIANGQTFKVTDVEIFYDEFNCTATVNTSFLGG